MRILADENVSHVVIVRLRASGFDVASIAETNLVFRTKTS